MFNQGFVASQPVGLKNIITITDTSTGSDGAITDRHIILQKYDGTFLVPVGTTTTFIDWVLGTSQINLDVLTVDTALSITVKWLASGGGTLYETTSLYIFDPYSKSFYYYLTQLQAQPNTAIGNDATYFENKSRLWTEIISAENAVVFGSDITSAQNCLNRAASLIGNENKYY